MSGSAASSSSGHTNTNKCNNQETVVKTNEDVKCPYFKSHGGLTDKGQIKSIPISDWT